MSFRHSKRNLELQSGVVGAPFIECHSMNRINNVTPISTVNIWDSALSMSFRHSKCNLEVAEWSSGGPFHGVSFYEWDKKCHIYIYGEYMGFYLLHNK